MSKWRNSAISVLIVLGTSMTPAYAVMNKSLVNFRNEKITMGNYTSRFKGFVAEDWKTPTTYLPLFYIMKALKDNGYVATWNGHKQRLDLNVPNGISADMNHLSTGNGNAGIYLDGTLVQRFNKRVAKDPASGIYTVYIPIGNVQQLLQRVGLIHTWENHHFIIKPGAGYPVVLLANQTYGPAGASESLNKNAVILGTNTTLRNMVINGNVYVNPGANGNVVLSGLTVHGQIYIESGANHSIHLDHVNGSVLYISSTSPVHIVSADNTNLQNTQVTASDQEPVTFENNGGTIGNLLIQSGQNVILTGSSSYTHVTVESGASVTVDPGARVTNLMVDSSNSSITVASGANVDTLNVQSGSNVKLQVDGMVNQLVNQGNGTVYIAGTGSVATQSGSHIISSTSGSSGSGTSGNSGTSSGSGGSGSGGSVGGGGGSGNGGTSSSSGTSGSGGTSGGGGTSGSGGSASSGGSTGGSQGITASALTTDPSAAPGSNKGTTTVIATPNKSGDTLKYQISSTSIMTPVQGSMPLSGLFTSGSNLTASSGDYVGVYELDSSGKVVAFSQIQLTSSEVAIAPTSITSSVYGIVYGATVTAGSHTLPPQAIVNWDVPSSLGGSQTSVTQSVYDAVYSVVYNVYQSNPSDFGNTLTYSGITVNLTLQAVDSSGNFVSSGSSTATVVFVPGSNSTDSIAYHGSSVSTSSSSPTTVTFDSNGQATLEYTYTEGMGDAITVTMNGVTNTIQLSSATVPALPNPTYAIAYDGNGSTSGSVPTDSNRYANGSLVTAAGNTGNLVKAGYNFVGWNTAADGSGTSYVPGATFDIGASNVTLYAQWVNANTQIVYNATELAQALQSGYTTVQLGQNITADINATRLVNIDLGGYTLSGNVSINDSTDAGTVTISNGTISGNLTVNTPNATLDNSAIVTGITTITDPAAFNNSGALTGTVTISDPGTMTFNNTGTLDNGLTIAPSATWTGAITLKGTIQGVTISGGNSANVEVAGTVSSIEVNANNATLSVDSGAILSDITVQSGVSGTSITNNGGKINAITNNSSNSISFPGTTSVVYSPDSTVVLSSASIYEDSQLIVSGVVQTRTQSTSQSGTTYQEYPYIGTVNVSFDGQTLTTQTNPSGAYSVTFTPTTPISNGSVLVTAGNSLPMTISTASDQVTVTKGLMTSIAGAPSYINAMIDYNGTVYVGTNSPLTEQSTDPVNYYYSIWKINPNGTWTEMMNSQNQNIDFMGAVSGMAVANGQLYAGTISGLFVLDNSTGIWTVVNGTQNIRPHNLMTYNGVLYFSYGGTVYEYNGSSLTNLGTPAYSEVSSSQPGVTIGITDLFFDSGTLVASGYINGMTNGNTTDLWNLDTVNGWSPNFENLGLSSIVDVNGTLWGVSLPSDILMSPTVSGSYLFANNKAAYLSQPTLYSFNNVLYAIGGSAQNIYMYDSIQNQWVEQAPYLSGVTGLFYVNNVLYAATTNGLYAYQ